MISQQRIESIEAEMDREGLRDVYDMLIASGQSPNMAAMFATRKAPRTWNTDSDFVKRENERMRSIDDENMAKIQQIARNAGIDTTGKTYNGDLGKYDDPLAWVADTHDVKVAALKKQMDIDGMVKVNGYRGPAKKVRLAEDLIDRAEAFARSRNKELDLKCKTSSSARKELRDRIVEKHSKLKQ